MMPTYDGNNFYQFYDFAVGDLVVYYDFDRKKTIGIVIKRDSNYLEIHWSGQTYPTTFKRSVMEEWGFYFCKYQDRKKYKDLMK